MWTGDWTRRCWSLEAQIWKLQREKAVLEACMLEMQKVIDRV